MFLYLSLQTCNQLIQKNHTLLNFFKLWGSEYLGSPNILDASDIDLSACSRVHPILMGYYIPILPRVILLYSAPVVLHMEHCIP